VESALEAACHTNGLVSDDGLKAVRATIASGMTKGLSEPRNLSHIDCDAAQQKARARQRVRPAGSQEASSAPAPLAGGPTEHREPPDGTAGPTGCDSRPVIRYRPSLMHEAVDRGEEILLEAGPGPIYQHNGQLVHITNMPALRSDGTKEEQQAIGFVEKAFFSRTVSQRARCERYVLRDQSWTPCNPQQEMADQYFALKQWRLPILRQIISAPLVRPDGSLLDRPGYDATTGLYLTRRMEGLTVPERPTEDQAARALHMLVELFSSYPFVDGAGREGVSQAVLVAGLLTSVQRAVLDFAPLFGISAPKAGTGKSHAVDVVSVIATGARADCVIAGSEPEEFKKTLGSKLCEGRPLFSFDNVPEGVPLQGQYLCTALTQDYVEHRVLGFGIMAKPSTCVAMFATGNNLTVRGDMTRRTLMCRMDAKMERPEQRTFAHDLRDEALRRRAELISAVLTIIRWRHSWLEESPAPWERAAGAMPLAGYQRWCRLIRDPLVALGLNDPVLSLDDVLATDDQEEGLSTLLEHWYAAFHETPKTARAVYESLAGHPALIDAIRATTRDLELKDPGKLGKYIAKYLGTRCSSLRFERGHKSYGNQTWMVLKEK
jgi:putative DNA primase/helicase